MEIIIIITAIFTIVILWGISPLIFTKRVKEEAEVNWQSNSDKTAINMLADDICRAKERIYLVGGMANRKIYGAPEVRKAIESIDKNEIRFKAVFGSLDKDEKGENPLEKYAKEGFLDLIVLPYQPLEHFRVIDGDYVYLEKAHGDKSVTRYYKRIFNSWPVGLYFENKFRELIEKS